MGLNSCLEEPPNVSHTAPSAAPQAQTSVSKQSRSRNRDHGGKSIKPATCIQLANGCRLATGSQDFFHPRGMWGERGCRPRMCSRHIGCGSSLCTLNGGDALRPPAHTHGFTPPPPPPPPSTWVATPKHPHRTFPIVGCSIARPASAPKFYEVKGIMGRNKLCPYAVG